MQQIVLGIVHREGNILVINRTNKLKTISRSCQIHCSKKGNWAFPGGEVEKNETHENAIMREIREEVGIKVNVGGIIATRKIPKISVKATYIECIPIRNQRIRRVPNKEALEAYWIPAAIVPDLFGRDNMDTEVIRCLETMS